MQKEWLINKEKKSKKSLPERLLALRGITKQSDIKEFLNPLEMEISDPDVFSDMKKAVKRISEAITKKENILIYGDFDADGVTSTSVLMTTLKYLNANVTYFIPNRETEGHGLDTKALVKLMTSEKPKVIITVDCGISNVEEIKFINSFKIDVILTDHHEAPKILPPALAIINPKAQNALDEKLSAKKIEHLTALAGVGVAFKLAQALLIYYKKTEFINKLLPYVTVGTIADLVPLTGENRYFVTKGLNLISQGTHYGLTKMLETAGYSIENGVTSEQITFGIAPRINVSGRLETVDNALKVLLSDNKTEVEIAVSALNNLNKVRQELCDNTFLKAEEMLLKEDNTKNSIILFNPEWHIGIIGIVASKLVEKYHKPTFLMTCSKETNQIKCSARSVKGINLYDTISMNAELLEGFGGHEMAAGLYFDNDKTTFEQVKSALNKTIDEMLNGKTLPLILNIDLELQPDEINLELIEKINKLEPFGADNPVPLFATTDLILKEKKLMGSNNDHLRLTVQKGNNLFTCVWWSKGDIPLISGDKLDIAFSPKLNTFKGNTSVQLVLSDIHSENLIPATSSEQKEIIIYDHRKKSGILPQVEDYIKSSKLDILVFAESKSIKDDLKPYNALYQKITTRKDLKSCDSVMLFDYPSSENCLQTILNTCKPKHLHFMPYETQKYNEKEFLNTISGMIKFACNNKNGCFNLISAASFLSTETDTVKLILNLLQDVQMIKILNRNDEDFVLEFIETKEFSYISDNKIYKEFLLSIQDIQDYRISLTEKYEFDL